MTTYPSAVCLEENKKHNRNFTETKKLRMLRVLTWNNDSGVKGEYKSSHIQKVSESYR